MVKLLIGSPIRQKPQILRQFLSGIEEADTEGIAVSCYFVDDNTDAASTLALQAFAERHDCLVRAGAELLSAIQSDTYAVSEDTHTWDNRSIDKIARFKDDIIEYALARQFDYLLFIDSDIVIDRRMIRHLISRDVEIVSNVFWTQWKPNWELEPQCFWIPTPEAQAKRPFSNPMTAEEARQLRKDFFTKMRVPGIYRVDGLGACTLIKRSALEKDVRFQAIPNLSIVGEDRHFCIRAGVRGIPLWLDTVYPAYHIYREAYLDRVAEFKRDGFQFDMCQTWNAPSPSAAPKSFGKRLRRWVRRGASALKRGVRACLGKGTRPKPTFERRLDRQQLTVLLYTDEIRMKYLPKTLELVAAFADACVLYDASEAGGAAEKAGAYFAANRLLVLRRSANGTAGVRGAFRLLWAEAEAFHPDWVLTLFAGELPEASTGFALSYMLPNQFADVYYVRRYDLWDETHYREDPAWELHKSHCPVLMRYCANYKFDWSLKQAVSVRLPAEAAWLRHAKTELKLGSLLWADPTDRQKSASGEADDVLDASLAQKRDASRLDQNPTLLRYDLLPAAFEPTRTL